MENFICKELLRYRTLKMNVYRKTIRKFLFSQFQFQIPQKNYVRISLLNHSCILWYVKQLKNTKTNLPLE